MQINRPLKKIVSICCLFLVALACTKDVGLFTEVEFQFLEEHNTDGFINQGLTTTFTVVPEDIIEGVSYEISYSLLQGNGYFEDSDGNRWEAGQRRILPITELSTTMMYFGNETGEHRISVSATDNFGFEETLEIVYNLTSVPVRWEASSVLTEIGQGQSVELSLLFSRENISTANDYEAKLEFTSGDGTIVPAEDGGFALSEAFATISPGTFPFVFTPSELGVQQLVFTLRDSNGQEITTELVFNVREFIEVISVSFGEEDTIELALGDEVVPVITFDPTNASDQGFTLVSSNTDVIFINENNNFVAVGNGSAIVTVTSTANPEATDSITITVIAPSTIPVTSIVVSQEDPNANGSMRQLIATVLPENASNLNVTWESSDTAIATIDDNGVLNGLSAGTVTITATSVSDPAVSGEIVVEITGGSLQNGSDITAFELPGQNSSILDSTNLTITVNVTDGTELNVTPSVLNISEGATITPDITQVQDFNSPVDYTVTAGDGTSQVWTVNVTVSPVMGNSENNIIAFALPIQNSAIIDDVNHTVTVNVPDGTELSNIAPSELGISNGATINPSISEVQDFNGIVEYTVTAENSMPQVWTVTTTVAANQPPVAVADNSGLTIGETIFIDVLANDSDPDTPNSELVITNVTNVSPTGFGTASISGGQIEFVSNGPAGEPATVQFDYTINDGNPGNDATATVTVTIAQTEILVTGITITPTPLVLVVGQIGQLMADVSPSDATNSNVDWTSDNPAVATVSATGEVTAISVGDAVITASSNDASDVVSTANVTVNLPASDAKSIDSFAIDGVAGTFNGTNITLELPSGTDVTALSPVISITGQSVNPDSGVSTNFTNPVTYTVTADDGSTLDYLVTVTVAAPTNTAPVAQDDNFTIPENGVLNRNVFADNGNGEDTDVDIDDIIRVIRVRNNPADVGLAVNGTTGGVFIINPNGDFSFDPNGDFDTLNEGESLDTTISYRISDANGGIDTAIVTVTVTGVSSTKSIDTFSINSVAGTFNGTNITLELPSGTDVTALSPVISITGQSVNPDSGVSTNFTNPVTYTVTADDGSTLDYLVTVTVAASSAKSINTFSINGVSGTFNGTDIALELPSGTDVTTLSPVISITGQSVNPNSGVSTNFTNPVTYTVTADDGSTLDYLVTVTVAASSTKSIDTYSINGVPGTFNGTDITLELPSGTDVTALSPVISITGQSVNPDSGVSTNFTNPVTYTVTADDGSTLDYLVTVTVAASSTKSIDTFSINSVAGTFNGTNITLELPSGTDVTALSPVISITGQSVNPDSGVSTNFTNSVTYTVTADDGSTLDYLVTVTVTNVLVTQITVTGGSNPAQVGDQIQFTADVAPSNATDPSVSWSSNNTSIATVNASGLVTAVSAGTTSIVATANDGSGVLGSASITIERITSFNRTTGVYSAPAGSLVEVSIASGGDGSGMGVIDGGGDFATSCWGGATCFGGDNYTFIMPGSGSVSFTASHNADSGTSNSTAITIVSNGETTGVNLNSGAAGTMIPSN